MADRYSRAPSPPRRYAGHPTRNSVSSVDLHPTYDQYGNPRTSRDTSSVSRNPIERLAPHPPAPPRIYRESVPVRGGRPEDYEIGSRRLEPIKRPLSVTPTTTTTTYRPAVASDRSPQHHSKPWSRDAESFYIQPASSTRCDTSHSRQMSLDTNRRHDPYLQPSRSGRGSDRGRTERSGYISSGGGGSRHYHHVPQIRPPRDKDDHDYGYEYTDFKEQAYRDTAPRPRARRTSDLGQKERPHSITGLEDMYAQNRAARNPREGYTRESGPPVSTRGFSKIDQNGATIRHEYRYPREPESVRSGDESDGPTRRKSTRAPAVALHQERPDGYGSNAEDRHPEKPRHRHRAGSIERSNRLRGESIDRSNRPRGESIDRSLKPRGESIERTLRRRGESFDRGNEERSRYAPPDEDARRKEHRERRQDSIRSESEDRRARHHHHHKQYREESQDRYKPDAGRREHGDESERDYKPRDRGTEPEKEHRYRDKDRERDHEKRRDDGKRENNKDKDESHFGKGAALGAAGAAAAGLLGVKHRHEKEKEKEKTNSEVSFNSDRSQRDGKSSQAPIPSETSSRSEDNSDEERRERRRRRRKEKEEKVRQEALAEAGQDRLAPPPGDSSRSMSRDRGGGRAPEEEEERHSRRHRGRQSEYPHSSSDSDDEGPPRQRHVRVVSPAKQPEIKPKGILRRPRDKFPEDPAPVREGVAPLNAAGKKGIPPNARWTKIDRRLVNPEALDMGNERFEERNDYVIVLRVLSKEEIEQYAAKTVELREQRHREATKRLPPPEDRDSYDSGDEDDYERRKPPPKAIENYAYNGNENALPREAFSQPPPPSMTASMPSLAPPMAPGNDNTRPELYPSNSYHRMAPPQDNSSVASSQTSAAYPPPPPPQQQQQGAQPIPGAFPQHSQQQPVTGEYSASGYPVVPPPSQPIYNQPQPVFNQSGYPKPPPGGDQGGPQNMPWQQPQPQQSQHEAEPVPAPPPKETY